MKLPGFTLVEMMIALSIFLILMSMLVVVFKATQEGFVRASALQKVFDTSRVIIERMHDEIRATFFDEQGRTSFLGIPAGGTHLKSDSIGDEVFFCIPLSDLPDADIVEIGYWLRKDGNLMRHYDESGDFDFGTAEADDELGLVIDNLTFRYFNGTEYQDSWDSRPGGAEEGKAPKAVKISFSVTDKERFVTKQFESVVHIVTGKRY